MQQKFIFMTSAALIMVIAAAWLFFPEWKTDGEKTAGYALAKTPAKAPIPVVTARVVNELFSETLEALGTAKANESVVLTPTVEDRVVGIFFDDGDLVRKNQVLLKLDDREARYTLAEAEAALHEQQKQFDRMRRLAKTNATSRSQLDEEKSLLEIAAAQVDNLEARLQDYTLRAPFAGILGIRQVSIGAVIDSDTVITTLDDISTIKLDFTVPENYLGALKNGMDISAHSTAYPDRVFTGKVKVISSRVDPETRTVTVRANIPNPDRALKPGMLMAVDLVKDRSLSLIIPEEAVILDRDQKFVLVVTSDNKVAKTQIVTGRRSPGKVEVLEGLNENQQVIIKGISRVRPGASVNVVEIRDFGRQSG